MRKILMLFLSFILISSIQTTKKDTFLNEVKAGYAKYEIVCDYEDDDYSLCVVRGINKNRATFGIYFRSICEDEYYIILTANETEYKFNANSEGDVYYPAMSFSQQLQLDVYNCDEELMDSIEIKNVNQNTFTGTLGQNQGISFNSPRGIGEIGQRYIVFYMIGIGIIVISAIIIIVLKVSHSGMFNDEARKEGIVDFRELEEKYVNEDLHDVDIVLEEDEYVEVEEEQTQVYERKRDYEEDLDTDRPSVKSILEQRGFRTDYANMSVEEKNKVMVELMMAREQKVINNDEYQHEIIELWKK